MVSVVEVTNIRTFTCKTNKLLNIYTIGAEECLHKKREINYFSIKIIQFIITFRRNYDISCGESKSKSIKEMCLELSGIYMIYH